MPSTTSSASYFPEEEHFPNERQIGFWKSESPADNYGYKPFASSPFGKFISVESQTVGTVGHLEQYGSQAKKMNLGLERRAVGSEMAAARPFSLWGHVDHDPAVKSNANAQSIPYSAEGVKISMLGTHYENGLFSSSLSDLFSRKLRIPVNSALYGHSADTAAPHCDEDEPFESLDEIEAQTIGNLLPDDDDLLSGVTDGLVQPGNGDDIEDLDLFSSVGGLDLGEDGSSVGQKSSKSGEIPNGHLGSLIGEHPNHPSRTLFIRNVNSSIDDSELQTLFEQYGDIHTLYTACKHRGFVMVSYYDLRAAQKAMPALQSKPLRGRKLDIHFSVPKDNPSEKDINQGNLVVFNLDSSVSNGELCQIFGVYGDIKEIWDTPHRSHHKVIEFYDIRAAEAALHALNTSDVAGNRIKLEPSHTSGGMSLMQQFHPDLEQEQYLCQGSPPTNSTIGFLGSVPRGKISSGSLDNGTNLSVDAAIQAVYSSPTGNPFYHGISCSVPNGLPSLDKVKLAGNQSAQAESKRTHGQLKVDYQGAGSPQPHSLPEYQDALSNDMSGNSLASLAAKISPASSKKFLNGQFYRASRNGHQMELKQDAYGSSGNGNCPLPGHHYAWSNSNQPRSSTMMWPNSPTFPNGMCTIHPPPQPHGHPSHPSHMVNPVLSINNNHVGSAPTVKPSLWDRRNAYAGESLEASGFHPASFGNMRMAPNSLHSLEFVPHGIFPHVGGNRMELPISPNNIGLHSHQSRCQIFPGRGQMVSVMSSFDSPNERVRGRRGDSSSNQPENKRQYELDLDRIMRGEDKRTTLMIKNIPNKYTSKMLLAAIDERHRGTYDFIYLPIDFKNKCNVGYAFINMTDPKHIISFYQTFNGKKWEKFNSEKVASLAYARIQGKIALIAHFQNSSLMNEDKRCRPILFHTEGPNAGDQVPFPMGVNIRPRPNKTRSSANEENHLANVEGCSSGDSCSGSIKDSD